MRHVAGHDSAGARALSEQVFWILLGLAGGPLHGYALMKDIDHLSAGDIRLTTGTLYGALRRLLELSWIERVDAVDMSRDKQPYRLTHAGRKRLKAELRRLAHATRAASLRLGAGEQ
jgi:DNA-binding PadR family transcriptional regulator